jgi:hypothetical protein
MDEIRKLNDRITQLEQQNRDLQERVGRWRRKAQGASARFEYVAERHERGHHYISIPVEGLPTDTPLHEAQEFIRGHVLPQFYPYRYWNCYSSKRYGGWVVTLVKVDQTIDMESVNIMGDFYEETEA